MSSGVARAEVSGFVMEEPGDAQERAPQADSVGRSDAVQITLPSWLRPAAPTWVWLSVVVAVVGFVLIAVAWGAVSDESEVYRQLPYVVSGGIVGMAMVMVGLTVLNVATRQRDAAERERQIDRLVDVIEDLRLELRDALTTSSQARRR